MNIQDLTGREINFVTPEEAQIIPPWVIDGVGFEGGNKVLYCHDKHDPDRKYKIAFVPGEGST